MGGYRRPKSSCSRVGGIDPGLVPRARNKATKVQCRAWQQDFLFSRNPILWGRNSTLPSAMKLIRHGYPGATRVYLANGQILFGRSRYMAGKTLPLVNPSIDGRLRMNQHNHVAFHCSLPKLHKFDFSPSSRWAFLLTTTAND